MRNPFYSKNERNKLSKVKILESSPHFPKMSNQDRLIFK